MRGQFGGFRDPHFRTCPCRQFPFGPRPLPDRPRTDCGATPGTRVISTEISGSRPKGNGERLLRREIRLVRPPQLFQERPTNWIIIPKYDSSGRSVITVIEHSSGENKQCRTLLTPALTAIGVTPKRIIHLPADGNGPSRRTARDPLQHFVEKEEITNPR